MIWRARSMLLPYFSRESMFRDTCTPSFSKSRILSFARNSGYQISIRFLLIMPSSQNRFHGLPGHGLIMTGTRVNLLTFSHDLEVFGWHCVAFEVAWLLFQGSGGGMASLSRMSYEVTSRSPVGRVYDGHGLDCRPVVTRDSSLC